jgi:DtxR family Mn-dependent transcriptional regulator
MNRVRLSDTVEDYLKAVYKLTSVGDRAGTGQIAELLGLSPASVTDMLQRLAAEDPPLLDYVKHRGASLTDDGQRVALEVIRHHRLLELFLHEVLGYSWDQVHEEADRLEHVISEDFEERVAEVLGDPQRGLHGEPIPSRRLEMPEVETRYLSDLSPGQQGTIHSVSDDNAGFLRYLGKQGLIPGAVFLVLDYSPYDHTMHLQIDGREEKSVLGVSATSQILVQAEANT